MMQLLYDQHLVQQHRHSIADYNQAIVTTGDSVSPNMHMLADHALQYCERNICGLPRISGETAESMRSECARYISRFKVPDVGKPTHLEALRRMLSCLKSDRLFE